MVETTADPVTAAYVIRPETPDDFARVAEVVAAAFGSDVEADLVERIRASPEFVPANLSDSMSPSLTNKM